MILIFCCLIANNHLKCGMIYKKTVMRAGDDERRINYEWPYDQFSNHGQKAKVSSRRYRKKSTFIDCAARYFWETLFIFFGML